MAASAPLRVIPLGGCGEFGLNTTVYHYGDELVVVDCGVMFPENTMFGVDVVLPALDYLREHRDQLRGYVITHGHEDHVGALPYALREAPAPVWATPFTRSVIQHKLREFPAPSVELHTLTPRQPVPLGDQFTVEAIRVSHSIPDAVALALRCPAGLIVHSGDFKMVGPGRPPEGTDLERLDELGDEGVLLAVSDSTGALEPGLSPSEADVADALRDVFATASGRIVVAQFASNLERLDTLVTLTARYGRRLVLEGRSVREFADLGVHAGHLHFPPQVRISTGAAADLPPRRLVAVVTGTQGEPGSALRQLAMGAHPRLHLEPGDTVVLSARVIPGYERRVARIVDRLYEQGATVIDASRGPQVHASGHGYREDLRRFLLLTRPRALLPVHGRYRMLVEHAELARQAGVERALLPRNGAVIEVEPHRLRTVDQVSAGRVLVDGKGVGDVHEPELRDRRALAATGTVVALIMLDTVRGVLVREPELTAVGVLAAAHCDDLLPRAGRQLSDTLAHLPLAARRLPDEVADVARRSLRRFFRRELDRKPVVIPLVIEP